VKTENSSILTTPLLFDDSCPRKAFKYLQILYCQKLESLTYIYAADSMSMLFILPLPMFTLEFRGEVNPEETRVMGLSSSEDRMIIAWVILTWHWTVTDRQMEYVIANKLIQRSAQQTMLTSCKNISVHMAYFTKFYTADYHHIICPML